MPRKSRSFEKHIPEPDPKYGSVKYAKFINYLMQRGKKNVARQIFYDALDIVEEKMGQLSSAAPSSSASAKATADKPSGEPAASKGTPAAPAKASADKKMDGRAVFDQALKNICPLMELKSRRIGGANYQVPMEVLEPRKSTLGMRWLILAAKTRKGAPMREKLAAEILDGYNKTGAAIKKREDTHRMAEANKAFAHFARFNRRR